MSNQDTMSLTIAASMLRGEIPSDAPLNDRLEFAMRYAREHARDMFWMVGAVNDDLIFRTAVAAVMMESNEEDNDLITRSMQPLKMLAAAAAGVPVDFAAFPADDDLVPLLKIFDDSKSEAEVGR